jgi:ABC-2 type transport system permease protein
MRTVAIIIRKEFRQIFRNKTMIPVIFIVPFVQLIVLVYAAALEMKEIKMLVVDKDLSETSINLVNKFKGSSFYRITQASFSIQEAKDALYKNETDIVLHIHNGFEKEFFRTQSADIQLQINAINSTAAGIISAYTSAIIANYNQSLLRDIQPISVKGDLKKITINTSYWYNPELNYKIYMVPGILVILVTLIGMFLSALNLVREKEMGTIEQINVTPIKKAQFIAGKLIPFWIIALFEMALGLTIGKLLFNLPIEGNLFLLFGFTGVYLLCVMGVGLFISAVSSTQQQVMFLAFFFMLTFIMMSGIFTPVDSMPEWAQHFNTINPLAYFMKVIRMILLKGSGLLDILRELIALSLYAAIILSLAVWRYRKTS